MKKTNSPGRETASGIANGGDRGRCEPAVETERADMASDGDRGREYYLYNARTRVGELVKGLSLASFLYRRTEKEGGTTWQKGIG